MPQTLPVEIAHLRAIPQRTLEKITQGERLTPAEVLALPLPPPAFWRVITRVAEEGKPWIEAGTQLLHLYFQDPKDADWPMLWHEPRNPELPRLTRQEALAVLDLFLRATANDIHDGIQLYAFQWIVLVTAYFPGREHFDAIRELVTSGHLVPTADARLYSNTRIHFPLTVTPRGAAAVRDNVDRAEVEAWPISRAWMRVERWWAKQRRLYPALSNAIGSTATDMVKMAVTFAIGLLIGMLST